VEAELSIVRAFLNYETWEKHHADIGVADMPDDLQPMYRCLDVWHKTQNENGDSLHVLDFASLFFAQNKTNKEFFSKVFDTLESYEPNPATLNALLISVKRNKVLRQLSLAAYDVAEGKKSYEEVQKLVEALGEEAQSEEAKEDVFVTDELGSLLDATYKTPGLRWRLNALNRSLGSLRKGDFGFIFARPECISGEAKVRVKYHENSSSSRVYTMAKLYKMFNGTHRLRGTGHQVQSTTPEGRVYYNNIEHVTYSGVKEVYRVTTRRGFSIKATADHEFLLASGYYRKLCDLKIGDVVRTDRTERAPRRQRSERCGLWEGSPYAVRMVGPYGPYHRAKEHRLAYDAHLNDLTVDDFVRALEAGHGATFTYSAPELDVHHINMDHDDNSPRNLVLMSRAEHTAIHAGAKEVGNGHAADPDEVVSIDFVGSEEVYDLGVAGPNKNFRADGVYVHNCGKTTFLASEVTHMAEQLDASRPVLFFVNEEVNEKVKTRVYQAALGITLEELLSNTAHWNKKYKEKFGGKILIPRQSTYSRWDIEKLCKKYNPGLVVVDQLTKVTGFEADRDDLVLGAKFEWARNMAKQHCPWIGVSQADGSGEGKKWLTMQNVANSKTAVQAEADFIVGIGCIHDTGWEDFRFLNISKNKLAGDPDSDPNQRHGKLECRIKPTIARYADL
jgi:hypothetical protein